MTRTPRRTPTRPAKTPPARDLRRRLRPNAHIAAQTRKRLGKHYLNRYGVGSR